MSKSKRIYISNKAAAKKLLMHTESFNRARREGRLPFKGRFISGHWLWVEDEIDAALDAQADTQADYAKKRTKKKRGRPSKKSQVEARNKIN